MTFETLITILTIDNLDSWQSLLPDNQLWHWTAFAILAMFGGIVKSSLWFFTRSGVEIIGVQMSFRHNWGVNACRYGVGIGGEKKQRVVREASSSSPKTWGLFHNVSSLSATGESITWFWSTEEKWKYIEVCSAGEFSIVLWTKSRWPSRRNLWRKSLF